LRERGNNGTVPQVITDESYLIQFTLTVQHPRSNSDKKTGTILALGEVYKFIGIDKKTYTQNEVRLFPKARKDPATGYRVFTEEEIRTLDLLWTKTKSL